MDKCVAMQLEAVKNVKDARRRFASAVQEYKAALKACEHAGKIAADRLGHNEARDYFASVGEVSGAWLDKVQGVADSLDSTLGLLVRESMYIVLASLSEEELEDFCNQAAERATPEEFASMSEDTRTEFMARRFVMGQPASPGGDAGAGENLDRESVERCASNWLRRWPPSGRTQ